MEDLNTLLRPASSAFPISDQTVAANLEWIKANPHGEAVFRSLAASTDPMTVVTFNLACAMGPAFFVSQKIGAFLPPKTSKSSADETPTWLDALLDAFALRERNAIYGVEQSAGGIVDDYLSIKNGTIKTQGGLPDLESPTVATVLNLLLDNHQSQQFYRTVDKEEFDGRSPAMVGKKTKLAWGCFIPAWRAGPKEKKVDAVTAPVVNGTTAPALIEAPAPDAEA